MNKNNKKKNSNENCRSKNEFNERFAHTNTNP